MPKVDGEAGMASVEAFEERQPQRARQDRHRRRSETSRNRRVFHHLAPAFAEVQSLDEVFVQPARKLARLSRTGEAFRNCGAQADVRNGSKRPAVRREGGRELAEPTRSNQGAV